MYKLIGFALPLLVVFSEINAGTSFINDGQYQCINIGGYKLDEQFKEILEPVATDSYPTLMNFSDNAISVVYGPSGFQSTTNYWGAWEVNGTGMDMFRVSSAEPSDEFNWDFMLIHRANAPITARKVSDGFRTFTYERELLN